MTDLTGLDQYLSSEQSPENTMQLSDLDGFLTGVLCSPEVIMPSEWLPVALGQPELDAPPEIIEIVLDRYNEIVAGLNDSPPYLEPVFWEAKEGHVIAMDWCEGFMDALHLRERAWKPLLKSEEGLELMFPIFAHLLDENGNSLVGAKQEQLDALLDATAERIPDVVPKIYGFWRNVGDGSRSSH
jgi:uncharacterized protein